MASAISVTLNDVKAARNAMYSECSKNPCRTLFSSSFGIVNGTAPSVPFSLARLKERRSIESS